MFDGIFSFMVARNQKPAYRSRSPVSISFWLIVALIWASLFMLEVPFFHKRRGAEEGLTTIRVTNTAKGKSPAHLQAAPRPLPTTHPHLLTTGGSSGISTTRTVPAGPGRPTPGRR